MAEAAGAELSSAFDEHHFRAVLGHFATGVAVVTALDGGEPVGLTIQSFCSLSLSPPLVLVCPALSSTSWPRLQKAGKFCVNLLAEGQAEHARQFARSGSEKFAGVEWEPAPATGSPVLRRALAWIDCQLGDLFPGGDHVIATGRVLALGARTGVRPLVFYKSGFGQVG